MFYANFRVGIGTWWNFAKVTSAKIPFFSQFPDFAKNAEFTFTFEQLKISIAKESNDNIRIDNISKNDEPHEIFDKICNDIYCSLEKNKKRLR